MPKYRKGDTPNISQDSELAGKSKEGNGNAVWKGKMQKAGSVKPVTKKEAAMRDALVGVLCGAGVEIVADVEEGQRVLDEANAEVKMQAKKSALETASLFESAERSLTVVSSAAGAKILRNLDKAI